jgi:hypothetical protein
MRDFAETPLPFWIPLGMASTIGAGFTLLDRR